MSDNATTDDLPPLQPESSLPTYEPATSPANPSSEDPITRSVMTGQLDTSQLPPSSDSLVTPQNQHEKPSSPVSHHRGGSTIRGGGPALSVLNLLRGRGQLATDDPNDDSDSDEEMGGVSGPGMAMPLGMMRPRGATSENMKKELLELHPYATILGPADVDSCVKLEEAVFPTGQAASHEKVHYRLMTCGELSLGMFSSAEPESSTLESPTGSVANAVETSRQERRGVLLGAIVATKTRNTVVRDEDMFVPEGWKKKEKGGGNVRRETPVKGHDEAGRTIALHSLAVVPEYQHLGLGTILMKSYVQRIMEADVADRIAILTYQRLIPYYTKLGFENKGKSDVKYGGGDWINMVLEFESIKKGEGSGDDD